MIGGGIGGLCLAIGLTKHEHLDVHVYEGTADYKDVGAGLAFHGNAIRAMALLDPAIKNMYFRRANSAVADDQLEIATSVVLAQGPYSGEVVAELGMAKGRKSIARASFLAGLYDLVPRDRVHFGKRLSSIKEEEDIHLTFKDGSTARADCVIGADGIHSVVRRYILGEDHPAAHAVNHEEWVRWGTSVPVEDAERVIKNKKWLTYVLIAIGPRGYIHAMPVDYGRNLNISVIQRCGKPHYPVPGMEEFEDYSQDAKDILEVSLLRFLWLCSP